MSSVRRLLANQNRINFAALWKRALIGSAILLLISLGALLFRGLNLGIEFEGGAAWEVRSSTVSTDDLRTALEPFGIGNARIQQVANDLYRVRAETEGSAALAEVKGALADAAGVPQSDVTANAVGASWGNEVTAKARNALIVFFIVLFIYIAVRLEWKMAVGALAAVAHDIIITVGIYALFQLEVTSATVIAFLTILGYSLYDTLVVFDKVRENERRASGIRSLSYTDVTSFSLNQVLMRSVNTTITSVMPVLAVLIVGRFILGAVTLQEFAIALLVGLLVGTYSSLFVATPLVAWLKEREPDNIERQATAAKSEGEVDIAAELLAADRARHVRSTARNEERRTPAGGRPTTVVKRRVEGGSSSAAKPKPKPNKRPGSDAKEESGAAKGDSSRAPSGEIKARPRKKKR